MQLLQRLPAEANLHCGEVLQRAQFAKRRTLARVLQIENRAVMRNELLDCSLPASSGSSS